MQIHTFHCRHLLTLIMQRIGWMTSSVAINGSGVKRFTVWMRCMFGRQFPVWWARFMHGTARDDGTNISETFDGSDWTATRWYWSRTLRQLGLLNPLPCSQNMTLAFYWGEVIKYRTIILAVLLKSPASDIIGVCVWCNIFLYCLKAHALKAYRKSDKLSC